MVGGNRQQVESIVFLQGGNLKLGSDVLLEGMDDLQGPGILREFEHQCRKSFVLNRKDGTLHSGTDNIVRFGTLETHK